MCRSAIQYSINCHYYCHAERREIYFIAIIDVLTQYGMKKQVRIKSVRCFCRLKIKFISHFTQAAKAAKTVKYGSNVDGISTCDPEQYAKRFIEFMDKAIE